jgi:hypothetical protein
LHTWLPGPAAFAFRKYEPSSSPSCSATQVQSGASSHNVRAASSVGAGSSA